ncbi:unnamed protein product, partial [Polarella glacialis]
MDDVPWRIELLLLTRAMGVPSVVSTHTDITHMNAFKGTVKLVWKIHLLSTHLATVHATVSRVFGDQMRKMYQVPIDAIWPPILWSQEFKSEPSVWEEQAAATRAIWLEKLGAQGCVPKAIMLFAGRWSSEKRIHLLWEAVPRDCALVIVGDGTSEYCQTVLNAGPVSGRPNVLPMRKMLSGKELRVAYAACDLFLSASNFETLGNTVIEAMCSGTPCALQPAQGHLEFVVDKKNSWFVDYDDTVQARATLSQIVAGGLDGKALETVLPDLAPLGKKFRTGNFAQDFDEVVLHKALAPQSRGVFGWLLEIVKRVCAMVTCFILFFIWRGFTRYAFITSREPQFEVLGQLGGAVDDKLCSSVWTLPCMRRPYNNVKEFLAWISGCRDASRTAVAEPASPRAAARQAADATDYESHYKSARRRNSAVLDVFQAGAGVSLSENPGVLTRPARRLAQRAQQAMDKLNYTEIKGRACRIMWNNKQRARVKGAPEANVFVKNLDASIDSRSLYDTFSIFGNILSAKVSTDAQGNSRGYGFVQYESVDAATQAIERVNGMLIGGRTVFVGPFLKREMNQEEVEGEGNPCSLYVKNIPGDWDDAKVNELFAPFGELESSLIVNGGRSERRYGFVNFKDPECATKAVEALHGKDLRTEEEKKEAE